MARNRKKVKIRVKYQESGKKKTALLKGTAEQVEFWNRARRREVLIERTRRVA